MSDPEKAWKETFEPLSTLKVEVDQPTKDRLLRQIHERAAAKPSLLTSIREQFAWAFHPLPALATFALLLMVGLTWNQFGLGGNTTSETPQIATSRTLYLASGENNSATENGARDALTLTAAPQSEGFSADKMIALAPDDSIENRYVYQFSGDKQDLDIKADETIYRVSYRTLAANEKQTIAEAFGFTTAEEQDNCSQTLMYSPDEPTAKCFPETLYQSPAGSLTFSGENATYLYYSTRKVGEYRDLWAEAGQNYDQLPTTLDLPDIPATIKQLLLDRNLVTTELASQLVVLPTDQIQYTCPDELYAQMDTTITSSSDDEGETTANGCYRYSRYPEEESSTSEFTAEKPVLSEFIPKPFQRIFVVTLAPLGREAENFPIFYATVDYTGAMVDFSGRLASQVESLPTQSASVRVMIDALNAGEIEAAPMFGLYISQERGRSGENLGSDTRATLTHQVDLTKAALGLTVYQGEDGSDYYVPSYTLTGTIINDQLPEDKAARADQSVKNRCETLQEELNTLYQTASDGSQGEVPVSIEGDEVTPIGAMYDEVKETPTIAEREAGLGGYTLTHDVISSNQVTEGEGSGEVTAGSEPEPGVDEPSPVLSPTDLRINEIYDELAPLRCYVFDYDPSEPTDYETTVPAFPGLELVMDGGAK